MLKASTMEKLECVLRRVAEGENLHDAQIVYQYASEKGDGYLGIVKAVELRSVDRSISLILKSAPDSDKLRSQTPIRQAFEVEIGFYDNILPAFERFQREHHVTNRFNSAPKCYATVTTPKEELVVLENLKKINYDMWNRKQVMNDDHIAFVFKEYGKFHGVSYAMKALERNEFDSLVAKNSKMDIMMMFWVQTNIEKLMNGIVEKLEACFNMNKERDCYERFVGYFKESTKHFEAMCTVDEYAVITHGDCWCNNMMFKYKDNQKAPTAMRLIDFQLSMLSSPIRDLSYFFYVCSSKVHMDNYERYLKIYHVSLTAYLQQYDLNVNDILPYETLLKQWRKYCNFGFMLSLMVIKIMLSDSEEAPDITKAAEAGENAFDGFNFVSKHEDEFRRRVKDVINHFYEMNLI